MEFFLALAAALLLLSVGFVIYMGILALVSKMLIKRYGAHEISWWS